MSRELIPDIQPLIAYINERWSIKVRREAGDPRPWTKDPIMHRYRFCNVFRRDDRTTRWLVENWYTPNASHPLAGEACAIARLFGLVETLDEIGFPRQWRPRQLLDKVMARRARGDGVYTRGYILYAGMEEGKPKPVHTMEIVGRVHGAGVLRPSCRYTSPFDIFRAVRTINGIGGFIAQEVTLDTQYTWVGQDLDWRDFAHAGPGAQRGLKRLLGRPAKSTDLPEPEAYSLMLQIRDRLNGHEGDALLAPRPFTAHDVEFNLCEVDKYLRAATGEGRPKSQYLP